MKITNIVFVFMFLNSVTIEPLALLHVMLTFTRKPVYLSALIYGDSAICVVQVYVIQVCSLQSIMLLSCCVSNLTLESCFLTKQQKSNKLHRG